MRPRTLLFLALLFVGLGGLWLAKRREARRGGPVVDQVALLPELVGPRVRAVRIDNLERGVQVKLERDAAGRWFLTEPLAYPAQDGLVRALFTALGSALGEPVADADPQQLGLDPPLAVIECTQVAGTQGEPERVLRLELGGLDLDPDRLFVRVPEHPAARRLGTVFRTLRNLYTAVDRNPDDYRDRRVTDLRATEVTGLRRRGAVYLAEEQRVVDLGFDALAGPDGWKRVVPVVTLDPTAMGLLVRGSAELRADVFADDSPRDLASFGLQPPAFSIELEGLSGTPAVLHFGFPPHEGQLPFEEHHWYAMRADYAHVWGLHAADVGLLVRPAELFYDQRAVRFVRADVRRVELRREGETCLLERVTDARSAQADAVRAATWSVRLQAGDGGGGPTFPADPEAVEETLLALERLTLGEHLPDTPFAEGSAGLGFALELSNGARIGGRVGAAARDPDTGARGYQYLRDGDEVPALIGEEAAEVCRTPVDGFRSRRVHRVAESLVQAVELEHGGRTFAFANTGNNVWNVRGQLLPAPRALVESLDGLLNLTARAWLEAPGPPERELLVRLLRQGDPPLEFTLALLPDGRATCTSAGGSTAEIDVALVERLLSLFD